MPIRTGVVTNLTAVVVTAAGVLATGCASAGPSSSAVQLQAPVKGAANVFGSDHACRDSSKNADAIRRILNLPPTVR